MQDHDWIELFQLIPESQHNILVLTTVSGINLSVETILRTELTYLVFRGRVCGNTEDGRAFFLPYRQIDHLQLNRVVKEAEIHEFYGDLGEGQADAAHAAPQSGSFPADAAAPGGPSSEGGQSPSSPASPAAIPGRGAVPAAARDASQPGAGRLSNVPVEALVPPAGGGAPGAPQRNSILERLRAQRNAILPPRPPAR
jgi:hypothetical protein